MERSATIPRCALAVLAAALAAGCSTRADEDTSTASWVSSSIGFVAAPDDDEGPTDALDAFDALSDGNPNSDGSANGVEAAIPEANPDLAAVSELVGSTTVLGASVDLAVSLPPLNCHLVYQAWLVVEGRAVSIGSFDVSPIDGSVVDPVHGGPAVFTHDAEDAAGLLVSIEDPGALGVSPGPTRVVAGPFDEDGNATLASGGSAAIGVDFSTSSGSFILATPTNGLPDSDELAGIWFENLETGGPSLDVPVLPEGWTYEAWAVVEGRPLSLGRFSDPASADDFDGFSATTFPAPNVPGEDFLINAPKDLEFPLDLVGQELLVTIEPKADTDSKPFGLTLFQVDIPIDAEPFVAIDLGEPLVEVGGVASMGGPGSAGSAVEIGPDGTDSTQSGG